MTLVLFYKGFGRWADNSFLTFIGDSIFPFPFYQKIDDSYAKSAKKMSWRRRVDINMAFYIFLLIKMIAIEIYYKTLQGQRHVLTGRIIHLFSSHLQAMIIVGMCLDSGKSYTTRFFKTRLMQFLGRISMALYLSHPILINVIKLFVYGPITLQNGEDNPKQKMPSWAIPIHLVMSLSVSTLLTYIIEEPARKFFSKIFANKG